MPPMPAGLPVDDGPMEPAAPDGLPRTTWATMWSCSELREMSLTVQTRTDQVGGELVLSLEVKWDPGPPASRELLVPSTAPSGSPWTFAATGHGHGGDQLLFATPHGWEAERRSPSATAPRQ